MNPFEEDIVSEPRRITDTEDELNRDILDQLLDAFETVYSKKVPRLGDGLKARLVLSPEAGYGKSHMIGRIFQTVNKRATLVYLRPYGSSDSCWQEILTRLLRELEYPERPDAIACAPGEPTQLDCLARHTVGNLLARLVEKGIIGSSNPAKDIEDLRDNPVATLESEEFKLWFGAQINGLTEHLTDEIQSVGIDLQPSRLAWVRVLLNYLIYRDQPSMLQVCRDWISGKPLTPEDLNTLGLKPADNVEGDLSPEQRNSKCFERLRDLCSVSSYYRPFIFCFDQTELYNRSEPLAKSFGTTLSRLRREVENHLTIVTANETIWKDTVFPHIEKADQDTISNPIFLKGVTLSQAQSIIRKRVQQPGIPKIKQTAFLEKPWLANFFNGVPERGLRDVLKKCHENWAASPGVTIESVFEKHRLMLLSKPKGLDFDGGVFLRVLSDVFSVHPKAKGQEFKSEKGYFKSRWNGSDPMVLFNLEDSNSFPRWNAILREAARYHTHPLSDGKKCKTKGISLRTPELKRLSDTLTDKINKASSFQLVGLTLLETAEWYAADEVLSEVGQGDLKRFPLVDVTKFLSDKMGPWIERLAASNGPVPPPPPPPPPTELVTALEAMIQKGQGNLIPWSRIEKNLIKDSLLPSGDKKNLDQVLLACSQLAHCVRVFSGPQNSVFKWIILP